MIPILGKLSQCSSFYAKFEQHWIECICVFGNPIIQCLVHKKVSAQKLRNCDLLHFRWTRNPNFMTKWFKKLG